VKFCVKITCKNLHKKYARKFASEKISRCRIIPRGTRTIRIHVEIMWDSVNHLLDAFNVADGKALECNI